MIRQGIATPFTRLLVLCLLTPACATTDNDQAQQDHYDALEQQQLSELESEEEARKFELLRPATEPGKNTKQEQERNLRYEQAVKKAEKRRGNLDIGFADSADEEAETDNVIWQTGVFAHPLTGKPACLVNSITSPVLHGELETRMQLIVDKNAIYLRTDAALDAQSAAGGITIDDGELYPVDEYLNELTGSITGKYQSLVIQMALGQTLKVSFRYAQQSGTEADHVVRLQLEGFTGELKKLSQCSSG